MPITAARTATRRLSRCSSRYDLTKWFGSGSAACARWWPARIPDAQPTATRATDMHGQRSGTRNTEGRCEEDGNVALGTRSSATRRCSSNWLAQHQREQQRHDRHVEPSAWRCQGTRTRASRRCRTRLLLQREAADDTQKRDRRHQQHGLRRRQQPDQVGAGRSNAMHDS